MTVSTDRRGYITPAMHDVYEVLRAASGTAGTPVSCALIANRLGLDRKGVWRTVARLEAEGLVARRGTRGTGVRFVPASDLQHTKLVSLASMRQESCFVCGTKRVNPNGYRSLAKQVWLCSSACVTESDEEKGRHE